MRRLIFLIHIVWWTSGMRALFQIHEEGGQSKFSIPLKSLRVQGEFLDSFGEVAIRQFWTNDRNASITGKYKFSLDTNAVVSGFQMKIGDKGWTGVVKAKETARTQFNEAVSSGLKSSLFEKISDSEYQVEIGPIAPSETAEIELHYLTHTQVLLDGSYRFVLPTNIAPKYINPKPSDNKADQEYAQKMASTPYVLQPPYLFDVDLTWHTGSTLMEIASPTNAISTSIVSATEARVRCTTAPEDGDFSLVVTTAGTTGTYSYQNPNGTTYLYVHGQIPVEAVPSTMSPKKITIMLDRSGSMEGSKIQEAVAAVDRFLSLLPANPLTLINIVSFGSHFDALYSHSVPAAKANIATIRERLKHFNANYGGTELLDCLRALVSGVSLPSGTSVTEVPEPANMEHVVVLLTDGQVYNSHSIADMLREQIAQKKFRVMTIGIGRDTDRNMVEQIAKETHALCRVLVDETDLTRALTDILDYIDKQYYTNMRVLDYEVSQVASVLYPAHPVDMFLRLTPAHYQEVLRTGLTLTAVNPLLGNTKVWHIPVSNVIRTGSVLEKLYADHSIFELSKQIDALGHFHVAADRRAQLTASIVELSVAHGIMNKHTSFLVISDQKVDDEQVSLMQKVEVPHHSSVSGMIRLATGSATTGNSGALYFGLGSGLGRSSGAVYIAHGSDSVGAGGSVHILSGRSSSGVTGNLVTIVGGSTWTGGDDNGYVTSDGVHLVGGSDESEDAFWSSDDVDSDIHHTKEFLDCYIPTTLASGVFLGPSSGASLSPDSTLPDTRAMEVPEMVVISSGSLTSAEYRPNSDSFPPSFVSGGALINSCGFSNDLPHAPATTSIHSGDNSVEATHGLDTDCDGGSIAFGVVGYVVPGGIPSHFTDGRARHLSEYSIASTLGGRLMEDSTAHTPTTDHSDEVRADGTRASGGVIIRRGHAAQLASSPVPAPTPASAPLSISSFFIAGAASSLFGLFSARSLTPEAEASVSCSGDISAAPVATSTSVTTVASLELESRESSSGGVDIVLGASEERADPVTVFIRPGSSIDEFTVRAAPALSPDTTAEVRVTGSSSVGSVDESGVAVVGFIMTAWGAPDNPTAGEVRIRIGDKIEAIAGDSSSASGGVAIPNSEANCADSLLTPDGAVPSDTPSAVLIASSNRTGINIIVTGGGELVREAGDIATTTAPVLTVAPPHDWMSALCQAIAHQQADGSLPYSSAHYQLLNYPSAELFRARALEVGVSPELYFHFHLAVLFRLESAAAAVVGCVDVKLLRDYVVAHVPAEQLGAASHIFSSETNKP